MPNCSKEQGTRKEMQRQAVGLGPGPAEAAGMLPCPGKGCQGGCWDEGSQEVLLTLDPQAAPPQSLSCRDTPTHPCYLSASFRTVQGLLSLCLLWEPHPAGDSGFVTGSRGVGEVSVTGLHLQEGRSPRSRVLAFLCSLKGKWFLKLWAAVITVEVSQQVRAWP